MNTRGASFMPNMRIEAGEAAWKGKRAMGTVESAKQQLQVMLSTMVAAGGEKTFPVFNDQNEREGDLNVKVRTRNEKTFQDDAVIGDTFRFYGYNASNRATDASNYPKMNTGNQIKEMLAGKAFELTFTETDGSIRDGNIWDLMKTELGLIAKINQRLYGKNWLQKRSWNSEEVQEVIQKLHHSELPWQGHIVRMANDIAGQFVDFDKSGALDPHKVVDFFREKTNEYREPIIKDLIGRMGLQIGNWTPRKGYFRGDDANVFKFDRDVEDAVGADLVLTSGLEAYNALVRSGQSAEKAFNILDGILQRADAVKAEAETGKRQARDPNQSTAETKYGIAERIRADRTNTVEIASNTGIEPDLLLRYWDFYFMSPLRYQTQDMQANFKKLEKEFTKNSNWFFEKFGEKLSSAKAEEVLEGLTD